MSMPRQANTPPFLICKCVIQLHFGYALLASKQNAQRTGSSINASLGSHRNICNRSKSTRRPYRARYGTTFGQERRVQLECSASIQAVEASLHSLAKRVPLQYPYFSPSRVAITDRTLGASSSTNRAYVDRRRFGPFRRTRSVHSFPVCFRGPKGRATRNLATYLRPHSPKAVRPNITRVG